MYTILCVFRVKTEEEQEFLEIQRKTGEMLVKHGALDHRLFCGDLLTGSHGSMGFLDLMDVEDHEQVYLVQTDFKSKTHYKEVMKRSKTDDLVVHLGNKLQNTVDISKMLSSTFNAPSPSEYDVTG
ncbi:DUF1428 family protein [Thalassobacillus hwangdonensis]|uniref:DUF1428 family protein n=1 Tax=Thalassobacillus hwangdonensis TaxID=546108 RepID=A0ABW3L6V2_9BACI